MIVVSYMYHRKSDDTWQEGTSSFDYPENAVRFIYKLKRSKEHVFCSYRCDYSDEHEFISMRINYKERR